MTSRTGSSWLSGRCFFLPSADSSAESSAISSVSSAGASVLSRSTRPSWAGSASAGSRTSRSPGEDSEPSGVAVMERRPLSAGSSARDRLALLLDLRLLAAELAEVVELRATDVAAGHDLDLADHGRVHRERALDADTEADLPHREGLADAAALPPDDDALEDLHALAVALHDSHVDLQRVTGPEVRHVAAQRQR